MAAPRRWALLGLALPVLSCLPGPEPFLVLAGPKDLVRIEVEVEEGETLWVLEAQTPRTLEEIVYGEIPAGFEQLEPPTGPPRPFVPGEVLITETTTLTRLFTHRGVASGGSTMVMIDHSMERRASSNDRRPWGD